MKSSSVQISEANVIMLNKCPAVTLAVFFELFVFYRRAVNSKGPSDVDEKGTPSSFALFSL